MRETMLTWFFQFQWALPQKVACHFLVFYTPPLLVLAALYERFQKEKTAAAKMYFGHDANSLERLATYDTPEVSLYKKLPVLKTETFFSYE